MLNKGSIFVVCFTLTSNIQGLNFFSNFLKATETCRNLLGNSNTFKEACFDAKRVLLYNSRKGNQKLNSLWIPVFENV